MIVETLTKDKDKLRRIIGKAIPDGHREKTGREDMLGLREEYHAEKIAFFDSCFAAGSGR